MRRRSEGMRPAEAPVRNVDRESFARLVAQQYSMIGIEASPWVKPAQRRFPIKEDVLARAGVHVDADSNPASSSSRCLKSSAFPEQPLHTSAAMNRALLASP